MLSFRANFDRCIVSGKFGRCYCFLANFDRCIVSGKFGRCVIFPANLADVIDCYFIGIYYGLPANEPKYVLLAFIVFTG